MDNIQTNTRSGPIVLTAATLLAGKEGHLAVLTPAGVNLPQTGNTIIPYVITDGDPSPGDVTVQPLSPETQVRIFVTGALPLGMPVIPDSAPGKITALPVTPGTYALIGIAEEAGVDGQAVLIRPVGPGVIRTIS